MKISSKWPFFENFKNFISFHETFKTKFSTHISTPTPGPIRMEVCMEEPSFVRLYIRQPQPVRHVSTFRLEHVRYARRSRCRAAQSGVRILRRLVIQSSLLPSPSRRNRFQLPLAAAALIRSVHVSWMLFGCLQQLQLIINPLVRIRALTARRHRKLGKPHSRLLRPFRG